MSSTRSEALPVQRIGVTSFDFSLPMAFVATGAESILDIPDLACCTIFRINDKAFFTYMQGICSVPKCNSG